MNDSRSGNVSEIQGTQSPWNLTDNITTASGDLTECDNETEDVVSDYIWKIFPPILFCVGLTGNILTIIVIKRLGFKKPTLMFLMWLALSDIVVLCTGLPRYWILYVFDYDLKTASNVNCKLYYFFLYMTMQYSSWILVGVTMERLIKVYFPMKYMVVYSYKKVLLSLLVTLIVLILVNGHFFFTNGINDFTEGECNSLNSDFHYFDENVFTFIDFSILCAVPFVIMLICNILLIKVLRNVQKNRVSMMHQSVYKRTHRFSVKMTKMLVVCTFYFLVATAPISIYFILDTYLLPTYEANNNCLAKSRMDLAWTVSYLVQYSNSCINFYLYTAMNKRFNKELMAFLQCRRSLRLMRVYTTQKEGSSRRRLASNQMTSTIGMDLSLTEENNV